MIKAVAVIGLGLEHHRLAVAARDGVRPRMPLDLDRAALHEGLFGLRRHGIAVFLEHRAHGALRLVGIELEVVGIGTQEQVRLGVVPALEGELLARLGRQLDGERGGLALHAIALAMHHVLARHGLRGLDHHIDPAGTCEAGLDRAVGDGLKGIGAFTRHERLSRIRASVAQVPAVEDIPFRRRGLGRHALALGNLEHHARGLSPLERDGTALERIGLRTHDMGVLAIHNGNDPCVAVDAVLADLLAVRDRDALGIRLAPFHKPVALLGIVGTRLGRNGEREDIAVLRTHLAVHHRYAVAEHLGAVEGLDIHQDGPVGFAEPRDQMAINLGLEDIGSLAGDLDAVLEPAHKRVVGAFTRRDHGLFAALETLLHRARGAAGGKIGLHAIDLGNRRDINIFLEHRRHLDHLGRRLGDGHGLDRRGRDLHTVLFPAHEVIPRVGERLECGDRVLIVEAAARHDAAHLGLRGGDDLDPMVAVRLIGIMRLLMVVDDLLDLGEDLLSDGSHLLDAVSGTDLHYGLRRDGVDDFAQPVCRGQNSRGGNRGDQRGLKCGKRLVRILLDPKMSGVAHIALEHKGVGGAVIAGKDDIAERIRRVVKHVARRRYRHDRHTRADTVESRG